MPCLSPLSPSRTNRGTGDSGAVELKSRLNSATRSDGEANDSIFDKESPSLVVSVSRY